MESLSDQAIRDSITAVFQNSAYNRSVRQALGDRIIAWVSRMIGNGLESLGESSKLRWSVIIIAIVAAAAVLARLAYVAQEQRRRHPRRPSGETPTIPTEPLQLAQRLAAAGQYLAASHALYLAVLHELRWRYRLAVDPTKTTGDYRRELATRSPAAMAPFRDFVREYEAQAWGAGACDADDYRRLVRFADPLLPAATGLA